MLKNIEITKRGVNGFRFYKLLVPYSGQFFHFLLFLYSFKTRWFMLSRRVVSACLHAKLKYKIFFPFYFLFLRQSHHKVIHARDVANSENVTVVGQNKV